MGAKRRHSVTVRAVTIADVASAAGVSGATVSRVMNGRSTVNADIADRVRKAVAELSYSPSGTARSLSIGKSKTVGVMVPDLANPTFQQILHGFNSAAAGDGYRILVTDSQEVVDDEAPLVLDARNRTDAVVLCAPRMSTERLAELLPRLKPAVVITREVHTQTEASVAVDYAVGIQMVAEHLIGLGHTRISYLDGPSTNSSAVERDALFHHIELAHPEVIIERVPCGSSLEDGYYAWDTLKDTEVTGVIAFNDLIALGLLGRLNEDGVPVPGRVSIVGFDDIPFARFAAPPLTTIKLPKQSIGEAAWSALRAELTGEADVAPTIFVPELVIRETTGRPYFRS
jgi:LacI family transcriptional regulator